MGIMSIHRAAIAQDIRRAFASVTLNDGISLHEGRELDDEYHPSPDELAAARALDTDGHWSEVPHDVLNALGDTLSFLDARGRQYYIPAFMVLVLDRPECERVSDDVLLTLINLKSYLTEFDSYTDAQKAAIARFLRYMIDEEDAWYATDEDAEKWAAGCEDELEDNAVEIAFNSYWNRFMPGSE